MGESPARIDEKLVESFVGKAHGDLPALEELFEREPALLMRPGTGAAATGRRPSARPRTRDTRAKSSSCSSRCRSRLTDVRAQPGFPYSQASVAHVGPSGVAIGSAVCVSPLTDSNSGGKR
jgi:hypothetical protein